MTKESRYVQACSAAITQLEDACHDTGILASTAEQDNYKRVWSRDGIIAGIAGLLVGNQTIINGLRSSLLTLAKYQLNKGTIPSNVMEDKRKPPSVSHGSLAGRVDATSWFVIGACLYIRETGDMETKTLLWPHVKRAIDIMDSWEYNDKHLIYTPLSGNWADEYPLHGYLLYDNILRYWGLSLFMEWEDADRHLRAKADNVESALKSNYWPDPLNIDNAYHKNLLKDESDKSVPYFRAGFNPAEYYSMFDASANGLMLLLGLCSEEQEKYLSEYINSLFTSLGKNLIPAFWPPINPGDPLWPSLEKNHAFSFKNHPNHFHNGGIWPVMMGIFCMGLSQTSLSDYCSDIYDSYLSIAQSDEMDFSEYIDSQKFSLSGKKDMSFSASGTIFMHLSSFDKEKINRILPHDR